MDGRKAELQVGAAVIVSIIVLVVGIMWGKGFSLSASRRPIVVEFGNVGGLVPGSNVLANGVVQGRVSRIVPRAGKVLVEASLDKDIDLYSDYEIVIESPTLMAGKVLAIDPGSEQPTIGTEGKILRGSEPLGVAEAVAMFKDLSGDVKNALKNLDSLVVNLNQIAGDSVNQSNVRGMLASVGTVASETAELMRENREQIKITLDQLTATIASAQRVTELADRRLGGTIDGVDSVVVQLSALAQSLRQVTANLNSDSTTVGRLLRDDELYIRLNSTLAEVDSLAISIRTKGLRNKIVLF